MRRLVLTSIDDGGCQAAFRKIPLRNCDDLLEGRTQDEVEPERRRPAETVFSGDALVEKWIASDVWRPEGCVILTH